MPTFSILLMARSPVMSKTKGGRESRAGKARTIWMGPGSRQLRDARTVIAAPARMAGGDDDAAGPTGQRGLSRHPAGLARREAVKERDRPWVMRTYSGHSSARASNELYRLNL